MAWPLGQGKDWLGRGPDSLGRKETKIVTGGYRYPKSGESTKCCFRKPPGVGQSPSEVQQVLAGKWYGSFVRVGFGSSLKIHMLLKY